MARGSEALVVHVGELDADGQVGVPLQVGEPEPVPRGGDLLPQRSQPRVVGGGDEQLVERAARILQRRLRRVRQLRVGRSVEQPVQAGGGRLALLAEFQQVLEERVHLDLGPQHVGPLGGAGPVPRRGGVTKPLTQLHVLVHHAHRLPGVGQRPPGPADRRGDLQPPVGEVGLGGLRRPVCGVAAGLELAGERELLREPGHEADLAGGGLGHVAHGREGQHRVLQGLDLRPPGAEPLDPTLRRRERGVAAQGEGDELLHVGGDRPVGVLRAEVAEAVLRRRAGRGPGLGVGVDPGLEAAVAQWRRAAGEQERREGGGRRPHEAFPAPTFSRAFAGFFASLPMQPEQHIRTSCPPITASTGSPIEPSFIPVIGQLFAS